MSKCLRKRVTERFVRGMAVVVVVGGWFPCLQIFGKLKVHNTAPSVLPICMTKLVFEVPK